MPEGDTIFRAARTLHAALAGRVVTSFETALATLDRVDQDTPLAGRTVERVRSVGKHLLIEFSGDLVLRTHMRMSGSWHVYRPGERWRRPRSAMRIVLATDAYVAVAFDVPVAEFLTGRELARHRELKALGPDLLDAAFDAASALERLRARQDRSIAEALLDQRAMAGVGNVFKSEALFVAGVHPLRLVSAVSDEELGRAIETARTLMRANVFGGGRRTTRMMNPDARLWVYGRTGRPCRRCGMAIESRKEGEEARATYWCPRCQK
ncbi:MAG: Fpg/Nei family DNA glycosylase [Acidobacteria bacterium]|nr:MAG: Fpg/Nei family DNA glycosylase [Acidobacteriota bacterium]